MNTFFFSQPVLLLVVIWSVLWKGYSLWVASKRNQKLWFIALLVFNTVGILDIIYIFGVAKKKPSDVQKAFVRLVTFKL